MNRRVCILIWTLTIVAIALLVLFATARAQTKPTASVPNEFSELFDESEEYFYARINWWSDHPRLEIRSRPTTVMSVTTHMSWQNDGTTVTETVESEGYDGLYGIELVSVTIDSEAAMPDVSFEYSESEWCPRGITMSFLKTNEERVVAFRNFSGNFMYFRQILPEDIGTDGFWRELLPTTEPHFHEVGVSGTIIVARQGHEAAECGRITWLDPALGTGPDIPVRYSYYLPIMAQKGEVK